MAGRRRRIQPKGEDAGAEGKGLARSVSVPSDVTPAQLQQGLPGCSAFLLDVTSREPQESQLLLDAAAKAGASVATLAPLSSSRSRDRYVLPHGIRHAKISKPVKRRELLRSLLEVVLGIAQQQGAEDSISPPMVAPPIVPQLQEPSATLPLTVMAPTAPAMMREPQPPIAPVEPAASVPAGMPVSLPPRRNPVTETVPAVPAPAMPSAASGFDLPAARPLPSRVQSASAPSSASEPSSAQRAAGAFFAPEPVLPAPLPPVSPVASAGGGAAFFQEHPPIEVQEAPLQAPPVVAESRSMESRAAAAVHDVSLSKAAARVAADKTGFAAQYPACILLVEDQPLNQKITTMLLSRLGYDRVDIANNGQEAVEMVNNGSYDIVFMDLQMPVMGGIEATREIRGNFLLRQQPVIIAMTGHALTGVKQSCMEVGMNEFLTKPVSLDDLRRVIPPALAGNSAITAVLS